MDSKLRALAFGGLGLLSVFATAVSHAVDDSEGASAAGLTIRLSGADIAAPPSIALPPGRVVTVSFTDASGSPWPLAEVVVPDTGLSHRQYSSHPHLVLLERRSKGAPANLVALLDGLSWPVHLELTSARAGAPTRIEVRLSDVRGGAGLDTASREKADASAAGGAGFDQAVREYLLSNPDVLREALDPARQLASRAEARRADLLEGAGVPVLGNTSGNVTVVEFFDYRCGFCKRSIEAVRTALTRANVRLRMLEYPILGEGSALAARAALAAARQGAYRRLHFALMEHEGEYDEASIREIATNLGLDVEQLVMDASLPEVQAKLDANRALAADLGVTGTPAFLVFGPDGVQVSPGALDADRLGAMIDAAGGKRD